MGTRKESFTLRELDCFLSSSFWLSELESEGSYTTEVRPTKTQAGFIEVGFSSDSDAWLLINWNLGKSLTCAPESLRLYRALTILALAIDLDATKLLELVESEVNANAVARILLESPTELPQLTMGKRYERTHDDCDGDYSEKVVVTCNASELIEVCGISHGSLRFRTPFFGGGTSGRVRNALILLALAIKRDNEDLIQPRLFLF